jgi:hypothetical protein
MLVEANGFTESVRTQLYRWAPHGSEKRAHGYAAVATELARESNAIFCHRHECSRMPEALMAMAMTLVARLKRMPGTGLDEGDPWLAASCAEAERWMTCASNAAREARERQQLEEAHAQAAAVEKAAADERQKHDAARTQTAAIAEAAADDGRACWDRNMRSGIRQKVQRNRIVRVSPLARVHIWTLTREIERSGDVADQSRAAFYADVASHLIGRVNVQCNACKLDVRRPKLELEQATDIMAEVDKMVITNGMDSRDLLAAVACTRQGLEGTGNLVATARWQISATSRERTTA